MKQRNMKYKFLAFIPFINTSFVLGAISDSINSNYNQKTNYKYILLALKILLFTSFFVVVYLLYNHDPSFIEKISAGTNIQNGDYLNALSWLSLLPSPNLFLISIFFFIYLSSAFIGLIVSYNTFYNIYREYDEKRSKIYIVIAILFAFMFNIKFISPFIVFMMRNNTPMFNLLNTKNSFSNFNNNPH